MPVFLFTVLPGKVIIGSRKGRELGMRIALCCINAKYVHSSLAPWYLAAAMEGAEGCEVSVIEGTINQSAEEIVQKILQAPCEVEAFCCYIWNIDRVRQVIRGLKARQPGLTVVLGGPEVTFRPQEILSQWPEVSYVLCGEGEESFPALMQALAQKRVPVEIPGLASRDETGAVSLVPARPLRTLPPSPYSEAYLSRLKGRIAYLETSRGCPFSCSFCLSGVKETVRFFEMEQAKANLVRLANSGAKTIKLIDRTFNCHPGRAYALLSFILEQSGRAFPGDVRFHFEVGADLFRPEFLALLAAAPPGLIQIEAGLQSFCEKTLEAVDRKTDLAVLTENLRQCIRPQNVHVHIDLIAGLPYEDYQTFASSFNQAFALRPHMLQLGFLKLLHGSKLRRQAETRADFGYRFSQDAPYEVQQTRWLSPDDLAKLHEVEDALERLYNSGRFLQTIEYLLQATGWTPFALLEAFGAYAAARGTAGVALDRYTQWLWDFFAGQKGVQGEKLRDCLVIDRLSCDNTGRIPPLLRREDQRLKHAKAQVRRQRPGAGKLGVALLYQPFRVAVFDYAKRDAMTGRYAVEVSYDEELKKKGRDA